MRNIIYILLLIICCITSCSKKHFGYVYDIKTKKPIENVVVYDSYHNKKIRTNKDGKFIVKEPEIIDLIFHKEGYNKVTIPSFSVQSGEFMSRNFVGDTIYLIPN